MDGGDEAKRISLGRVAKGLVMNKQTKEIGKEGPMTSGKGSIGSQQGQGSTPVLRSLTPLKPFRRWCTSYPDK